MKLFKNDTISLQEGNSEEEFIFISFLFKYVQICQLTSSWKYLGYNWQWFLEAQIITVGIIMVIYTSFWKCIVW